MSPIITCLFSSALTRAGCRGEQGTNRGGRKEEKSPAACSFLCPAPAPAPRSWLHRIEQRREKRRVSGYTNRFTFSWARPPPFRLSALSRVCLLYYFVWPRRLLTLYTSSAAAVRRRVQAKARLSWEVVIPHEKAAAFLV